MPSRIVLIGGAPTVGKSFLAKQLAEKFEMPWISTDIIRDQMRKIVRKEDYPALFDFDESNNISAKEYLTTHTPEQIVDDQNRESVEVWKGTEAIIETDYVWGSFVVEGVAVLPELVAKIEDKSEIIPIFIIDRNRERIRNSIFTRGLWGGADTYPDEVKEIEIEWVLEFNKYIEKESLKYGFKIFEVKDRSKLLGEIASWLEGKT